jgi:membrane protein implicated in regulation of membrane protease activity
MEHLLGWNVAWIFLVVVIAAVAVVALAVWGRYLNRRDGEKSNRRA